MCFKVTTLTGRPGWPQFGQLPLAPTVGFGAVTDDSVEQQSDINHFSLGNEPLHISRSQRLAFSRHGFLAAFDCLFIFDCLFQNLYLFFIEVIAGNVSQAPGLLIQLDILAG